MAGIRILIEIKGLSVAQRDTLATAVQAAMTTAKAQAGVTLVVGDLTKYDETLTSVQVQSNQAYTQL